MKGTKSQGHQSDKGPAQEYREGLAALDRACKTKFGGKAFADLSDQDKDAALKGLESGEFKLDRADGEAFFNLVVKDVQMGFFADPIYGGNRDMVAWKMIGYPGARYNYLHWVNRHNERFPLPRRRSPIIHKTSTNPKTKNRTVSISRIIQAPHATGLGPYHFGVLP